MLCGCEYNFKYKLCCGKGIHAYTCIVVTKLPAYADRLIDISAHNFWHKFCCGTGTQVHRHRGIHFGVISELIDALPFDASGTVVRVFIAG